MVVAIARRIWHCYGCDDFTSRKSGLRPPHDHHLLAHLTYMVFLNTEEMKVIQRKSLPSSIINNISPAFNGNNIVLPNSSLGQKLGGSDMLFLFLVLKTNCNR